MDLISHAVAGAATGAAFGRPVLGACVAVTPDLVLGIKRRAVPNTAYDITHCPAFACSIGLAIFAITNSIGIAACVTACLVSHIALDLQTHCSRWAPKLLFPFAQHRHSCGDEWEWFNRSWWIGLITTILWSATWIALSPFVTGFLS